MRKPLPKLSSTLIDRASRPSGRTGRRNADDAAQRGPTPAEAEVYDILTRAIITKQIRPGSRLPEATLASNFQISRARVHRVLQKLAELDVVEFRLNFGAFVSRPSPAESRAVFRTRRVLEVEAVRAATMSGRHDRFDELAAFVKREAVAFEHDEPGVGALSSDFHVLVAGMSDNGVLAKMLNQLIHRCVLIQALYERQGQKTICLVDEHATIIEFMRQKRIADAVAAMEHHLDHIESSLDYSGHEGMDERLLTSLA
jgi:DNA-binding GntR family transcriptional regulator